MIEQLIERFTLDANPSKIISARRAAEEEENRKKGMKISIAIHLLLLLIFIFPLFAPQMLDSQARIAVQLGYTKTGDDDNPPIQTENQSTPSTPPIAENKPTNTPPTPPKPTPKPPAPKPNTSSSATSSDIKKNVVSTNNADTPAIQKTKEKAKIAAEKAQQEAKEQAQKAAAEKAAKAEAAEKARQAAAEKAAKEAEAKRLAEAKRREEAAKKFGFNNNDDSKGNTDDTGNQGANDGDPNIENLIVDIETEEGETGLGYSLNGRKVTDRPTVEDNSNEVGKIRIKICVDKRGNVISADYAHQGSTLDDARLKALTIAKAKEFKFEADDTASSNACGWINFDFKVK